MILVRAEVAKNLKNAVERQSKMGECENDRMSECL